MFSSIEHAEVNTVDSFKGGRVVVWTDWYYTVHYTNCDPLQTVWPFPLFFFLDAWQKGAIKLFIIIITCIIIIIVIIILACDGFRK